VIIFRPGYKPVDDSKTADAPSGEAVVAPLPSVSDAMRAALARHTQTLPFTGPSADAPSRGLVDTSTGQSVSDPAPTLPEDPALTTRTDEEIEAEATAILAALAAKRKPHSINATEEVQK
jgi:hypothetical protein